MIELRETINIPTLLAWRKEVLENVFKEIIDNSLLESNLRYYEKHMENRSHLAIVANIGNEEAGCGSVCFYDELPSPDNLTGRCAYIMNVYVRRKHRKQGLGKAIVEYLVNEARKAECGKIYLETTSEARSLYEKSGFRTMKDMMKL